MAALYECLLCVMYFTVYVYVCVCSPGCVPLYSAKGIDDVALNKKLNWLIDWLIMSPNTLQTRSRLVHQQSYISFLLAVMDQMQFYLNY